MMGGRGGFDTKDPLVWDGFEKEGGNPLSENFQGLSLKV
jgi:hypothetical protein